MRGLLNRNFLNRDLLNRDLLKGYMLNSGVLNKKIQTSVCCLILSLSAGNFLYAAQTPDAENNVKNVQKSSEKGALNTNIEDLKAQVLKLNRDLFILEEDLLYPSSTSVTLYVSMDKGDYFDPKSLEIQVNGERVTSHLYTEREVNALSRGGIQKVHQGNVKKGDHELVAVFVGDGPEGRDYRRALRHQFSHTGKGVHLELQISDNHQAQQPVLSVKEWQN